MNEFHEQTVAESQINLVNTHKLRSGYMVKAASKLKLELFMFQLHKKSFVY